MARWLTLLLVLTAPGCGHFEDMMLGPETCAQTPQPAAGCSQSAAYPPNIVQTQEPPR